MLSHYYRSKEYGIRRIIYTISFFILSYAHISYTDMYTQAPPLRQAVQKTLAEQQKERIAIRSGKQLMVENEYGELVVAIPGQEKKNLEAAEKEESVTDEELEKLLNSSEADDEKEHDIDTSPTLLKKLKNVLSPVTEKLKSVGSAVADKQNLVSTFNRTATTEQGLYFDFPYLGKGTFMLEPDYSGQARLNVKFTKNGKETLKIRPVVLDEMRVSLIQDTLKGQLHKSDTVTVFGQEARFRLRKLQVGQNGELINKISFDMKFKTPLQQKLPYQTEPLIIKGGILTLQSQGEYPIMLNALTEFRGRKVRVQLLYTPQSKLSAAIVIKPSTVTDKYGQKQTEYLPLKSLLPQVVGTPLEVMQITRGRILWDIWVPSPNVSDDQVHIAADDPHRRLLIEGDLNRIPKLEITDDTGGSSSMEDVTPAEVSQEIADEFAAEAVGTPPSTTSARPFSDTGGDAQSTTSLVGTDTKALTNAAIASIPDIAIEEGAPTSDIPLEEGTAPVEEEFDFSFLENSSEPVAGLDQPDIVPADDAQVDPFLIDDALPDLDYVDPAMSEEDAVQPEEEAIIACDYLNDPCCRERTVSGKLVTEPDPTFSFQALATLYGISTTVVMNDIEIPHVGLVGSATVTLSITRGATAREDIEFRSDLKKKTLKNKGAELTIDLSCVPIKHIGMVEYGTIILALKRNEKEKGDDVYKLSRGKINLMGRMRLSFGALGKLPIDVNAAITRRGLIFTGKLDFCQTYAEKKQSATGAIEKEQACTKNSLSYGGITLENVKVMYGPPRFTAAELEERSGIQEDRAKLREAAKEQQTAVRELRSMRTKGETPSDDLVKKASATAVTPNTVRTLDNRKTTSLVATVNLWGIRLIATLAREPDPKNLKKYKIGFSAKGVLRDFQPFKYIPGAKDIQGLKDVTFEEISAELRLNTVRGRPRPSIKIGGAVALFGLMLRANFKWVMSKKGVPGVFIYTTPQRQQSLTDLMPVLQNDFFRNITCCNSSFALSSVSEIDMAYFSAEEEIELMQYRLDTIRKGVAFVANVPFTGTLDQLGKWLGVNKEMTESEKKRADRLAKSEAAALAEIEAAEAKARAEGKPIPARAPIVAKNLCKANLPMFRMMANINLTKPQFSEFRIGITRNRLKQLSATALSSQPKVPITDKEKAKYKSKYSSLDTRFSDTSFNPFAEQINQSTYYGGGGATSEAPKEARNEPVVELDQVEVFFLGDAIRPSFGVAAGILVRPTPDELLRLKGSIEFAPTTVSLGAQMLGTWHNAFTLKEWDLSDVGIVLGFVYGSWIPTRLGGAADLTIKKDFAVKFKFMADANLTEMGFEGSVSRVITLFELARMLLNAVNFKLPPQINIPMPLELTNTYIKYAPRDIRIGDQYIEAGFAVKTDFSILGKDGKLDIHADYSGLKAYGTMQRVDFLGLLKITSADGKGDPKVDIELTMDRQNFLITGLINVANIIEQSAFVQVSSDGFEFEFIEAIGKTAFEGKPLLMAKVAGKSSGSLKDPQFTIIFDFQQNFQRYIKQQATEKLLIAEKAVEDTLNQAQRTIDDIGGVIKDADNKIKEATRQVQDAKKALQAIRDAKAKSNAAFDDAKRKVAIIRKEIEELDRWYDSLPAV